MFVKLLRNISPYENGIKRHYGIGNVIEVPDELGRVMIGAEEAVKAEPPQPEPKPKKKGK